MEVSKKKQKIVAIMLIAAIMTLLITPRESAVGIHTEDFVEKKNNSPLFRIRTAKAIREKIERVISKNIGETIFFVTFPAQNRHNLSVRKQLGEKTSSETICVTYCGWKSCPPITTGPICRTLTGKCNNQQLRGHVYH